MTGQRSRSLQACSNAGRYSGAVPDSRSGRPEATSEGRMRALDTILGDRTVEVELRRRRTITERLDALFDQLTLAARPTKVVEVGAFEAAYSQRMKKELPVAEGLAFEANPRVAEKFIDQVNSTGVVYRHLAIGSETGTATIHIPEVIGGTDMPYASRMGSLNVVGTRDSRTVPVEVPMTTLDAAVPLQPFDRVVLWIDVEGAVDQVLSGAATVLDATAVMVCEMETSPIWTGQVLAGELRQRLEDSRFVMIARDCQKSFQYNAVLARRTFLAAHPEVDPLLDAYLVEATQLWVAALVDAPASPTLHPNRPGGARRHRALADAGRSAQDEQGRQALEDVTWLVRRLASSPLGPLLRTRPGFRTLLKRYGGQ